MISSLAASTIKQYNSPLKEWWNFCSNLNRDPLDTKPYHILEFLTQQFNAGASYGTLNSARSAISLISSQNISDNNLLSRFFKGVFKLRPLKPRYESTWDTAPVLEYISKLFPMDTLNLHQLSDRTIILLALATAQRAQTLASISLENIKISTDRVQIKITDILKTSGPGRTQPFFDFPFLKEKPVLCVAQTLIEYIKRTKSVRHNENKLFISFRSPYKPVTSQTISRWIKSILKNAGIDEKFKGHSVRHAATSKAAALGVNWDIIRKTAGWTQESQVFARFYHRPILTNNNQFVSAVLLEN